MPDPVIPHLSSPLADSWARTVDYVRVSVTDRCNYRCTYCMPEGGVKFMDSARLLRYEETARIINCFAGMGVRRIRLTGGEPLLRRQLHHLVAMIRQIPGIEDIAMTTNGHLLAQQAEEMVAAGLTRFNVSLDSLNADRFREITRGGELNRVLDGIDKVISLGAFPLKINMVVMPGFNTDEIVPMVQWAIDKDVPMMVRLIEYMPFRQRDFQVYSADQMEMDLREHFELSTFTGKRGGGPAQYLHVEGTRVDVGFIAPITRRFCSACNRVRLSADGRLRSCLAYENTPSLRDLLRAGASDVELAHTIHQIVLAKPEGHGCAVTDAAPKPFEGYMSAVGG